MMKYVGGAVLAAALAGPALAAPVEVITKVMAEQRIAASDGSTRTTLAPVGRVTPGDRLVYQIGYRNTGPTPVSNFVLTNPLPASVEYAGASAESEAIEMSVDGSTFASLANLRVRLPAGGTRAATTRDVRVVRWKLARALAPGAQGNVSFRATLR